MTISALKWHPIDPWIRRVQVALVIGGLLLVMVLCNPYGFEFIEAAGRYILQTDMLKDYVVGVVWALLLSVTLFLWPIPASEKRVLGWLWLAKCEMMLGFMLYYEWNYGLDASGYWAEGQPGFMPPVDLHYGDGNGLIVWISQLHWNYLVADSYHAMKVSFGMIGLVGVYVFYRAASAVIQRRDVRLLFVLGILPSSLQWSSIIGKDPLTFLGIGSYCAGVVHMRARPGLRSLFAILFGVILASTIRPWMAAILLAPLVAFALLTLRGVIAKAVLGGAAAAAFVGALFVFSDALHVASVDDVVSRSESISQEFSYGGSANESQLQTENSPTKMLLFAPLGIVSALFRPLPGEVLNVFGLLASLENLLLIVLFVRAVRRSRRDDFSNPVISWAVLLVLVWSLIYGFVCYHNMGTSVRYRFQIFPVFFTVLLYLGRERRRDAPAIVTA